MLEVGEILGLGVVDGVGLGVSSALADGDGSGVEVGGEVIVAVRVGVVGSGEAEGVGFVSQGVGLEMEGVEETVGEGEKVTVG